MFLLFTLMVHVVQYGLEHLELKIPNEMKNTIAISYKYVDLLVFIETTFYTYSFPCPKMIISMIDPTLHPLLHKRIWAVTLQVARLQPPRDLNPQTIYSKIALTSSSSPTYQWADYCMSPDS